LLFWELVCSCYQTEKGTRLTVTGGVGKSCLTGTHLSDLHNDMILTLPTAQFVQNVWIESYDPTIEDSYRKQIEVDVSVTYSKYKWNMADHTCFRADNVF
jgi:hypothetical protein